MDISKPFNVYVNLQRELADWEIGLITAELRSRRFFREGAPEVTVRTVAESAAPIRTMGGMNVVPDCTADDMVANGNTVLILPGSGSWPELASLSVMDRVEPILSSGGTVCAICGATVALADRGFLDTRRHTSNGPGFLDHFSPNYRGSRLYVDSPAVSDGGVITAGSPGGLPWSKLILERMGVFSPPTLDAWFAYFDTCDPKYYYEIEGSLH